MRQPLEAARVYRTCPESRFEFRSTAELVPLDPLSGHGRASEALDFGTAMRPRGFNLFVLGEAEHLAHQLVLPYLQARSARGEVPPDCCYLHNFDDPSAPRRLCLPAGMGRVLRGDIEQLVEELRVAIPAIFDSDEYQNRLQELKQAMSERQRDLIEAVRREAREHDIVLLSTPNGFSLAPAAGDGMMSPEAYEKLPKDDRERLEGTVEILQRKLQQAIRQMPRLASELRQQIQTLNEEMLQSVIAAPLEELEERYREQEGVVAHFAAIREALLLHLEAFLAEDPEIPPEAIFSRCQLNLLVDNGPCEGAPVVQLDLPSHQHLVGRIEHHVHQGTLLTDFSLIRAGALHRANGGYLVLDARALLQQPGAWETLKRALRAGEIRTESLEQAYGLISTVTLEPEPIPLEVKVVLCGERHFYYLLSEHDPEFLELFKVQADLDDELSWGDDSLDAYARLIATLAQEAELAPLAPSGVAAVIERAARLTGDQQRLMVQVRPLNDLLAEAAHWAGEAPLITREHVEQAVIQQRRRAGRVYELSQQRIHRGTVMIATDGAVVGQVNGLSVVQLGGYAFGQPSRITATARPGPGQVVDIEREAKLGGRIHTKAVMILSRWLANRYAPRGALSLSASLAFEQSYGGIEGDSASVAEACVLVSAIARVPLAQSLAVTGSINQHGEVQAVGGVNEKVEGFFAVCREAGLAGQGVILPAANVPNLMLDAEVRQALAEGRFFVYAVTHLDEALELLTGLEPGEPDAEGAFPQASLNARVVARLDDFRRALKRHDEEGGGGGEASGDEGPGHED
ncbi:Lon protease family protein [Halomonas sp. NCCP-2165]|nr:ATP-binding protein [Halomonas sp. NCCP-2165]GKW49288.1 ATP-dependent protease [Halomonas sp. NCCP-2165]